MFSSLVWGLLAHGVAFFNKYSYHDDALWTHSLFDQDTYALGRWGRALLGKFACLFFGSDLYSTPAFSGFITIFCVAVMMALVTVRLNINNKVTIVGVTGVMVSFPAITGMFGFMFVSPYFYIGSALGVIGAYIYYSNKNVKTFIICTLLMAYSTGLYQANIPIDMMVLLLFMLDEVYSSDMEWKEYFMLALKNVLVGIAFIAEYFVLNKILLTIKNVKLSGYKGIDNFGFNSIGDYLYRVYTAYKRFVKPEDYITDQGVSANMYPWNIRYYHIALILVSIVLVVMLVRTFSQKKKMLQVGIIIAISPLFAYFIYVMAGEPDVHGLMTFGEVFLFFIPAYVMEKLVSDDKAVKILKIAAATLILIIGFANSRYANVCYLKAELMQTEAISYFNVLISRIQQTEGYTKDMPVEYINPLAKNDEDFSGEQRFNPIWLPPYNGNSIINDYSWEEFMKMWCGFDPVRADEETFSKVDTDEISSMPAYPDEGSVKVVDGVMIVKF